MSPNECWCCGTDGGKLSCTPCVSVFCCEGRPPREGLTRAPGVEKEDEDDEEVPEEEEDGGGSGAAIVTRGVSARRPGRDAADVETASIVKNVGRAKYGPLCQGNK